LQPKNRLCDEQIKDLEHHREEHERLLEDLENLDLPEDEAGISLIVCYLREWLLRHIHGSDQKLATALLAKNDSQRVSRTAAVQP
jgi:hemerythrin